MEIKENSQPAALAKAEKMADSLDLMIEEGLATSPEELASQKQRLIEKLAKAEELVMAKKLELETAIKNQFAEKELLILVAELQQKNLVLVDTRSQLTAVIAAIKSVNKG